MTMTTRTIPKLNRRTQENRDGFPKETVNNIPFRISLLEGVKNFLHKKFS